MSESTSTSGKFFDQLNCLAAGLIVSTQSTLLIYYLYLTDSRGLWFLWVLADIVILGYMVYASIICYARRRIVGQSALIERFIAHNYPGDLPYAFGFWLLYSVALVTRWCLMVKTHSIYQQEASGNSFGISFYKVILCMSLGVYYFFVKSVSICSKSHSRELAALWLYDALNLLDGADLLTAVLVSADRQKLPTGLEDAILAFAGIVFFIPIFHLAIYSTRTFHRQTERGEILQIVHALLTVFVVDLPLLVVRLLTWRLAGVVVSGFVIKNILYACKSIETIVKTILNCKRNIRMDKTRFQNEEEDA